MLEPDTLADDIVDYDRRLRRRAFGVPRSVKQVRSHTHCRIAQPLERLDINRQLIFTRINDRKLEVAVRKRTPMSRNMLNDAQRPSGSKTLENGLA